MRIRAAEVSILSVIFALVLSAQTDKPRTTTCSTFLLKGQSSLLVGHNLDEVFHTPGWVVVSPRGVVRQDVCGHELAGRPCPSPDLRWVARYGSVAFSFGADLADGGMNEAGLTVSEMGLGSSKHPYRDDRPTLLTREWIRYQLDMYATVNEVLANLDSINIDGNNLYSPVAVTWSHYFMTDAAGNKAIIEFLDGTAVVHQGEDVDVPVLCNDPYTMERDRLGKYWRFGGWMPIFESFMTSYSRFVQGAYLTSEYAEGTSAENVAYAFDLLGTMQRPTTKQWSIVYDVKDRRAYFRTAKGPSVRFLDMDDLSFEEGAPIRVLTDIHADASGDVASSLVPYNDGIQAAFIQDLMRNFASFVAQNDSVTAIDAYLNTEEPGLDLELYTDRAIRTAAMIREPLH